ncbi:hypothetical protein ALP34_02581 [Pseudomonas savastanoi pv. glycinea]|nr:hypothetical protein ALP34_02581 [Pseudomonas savastanoi pv. glycinea]
MPAGDLGRTMGSCGGCETFEFDISVMIATALRSWNTSSAICVFSL